MLIHPPLLAAATSISPKAELPARLDTAVLDSTPHEMDASPHEQSIDFVASLGDSFHQSFAAISIEYLVCIDPKQPSPAGRKSIDSEAHLDRVVHPSVTHYLRTKGTSDPYRPVLRAAINNGDTRALSREAFDATRNMLLLVEREN